MTAFQFSNRKKQSLKSTLLAQQVFRSGNTTINALLGKKLHFYKPFPIFVSLFSILAGKEEEILANGGYFWWFVFFSFLLLSFDFSSRGGLVIVIVYFAY